jgi:hypothetical protein
MGVEMEIAIISRKGAKNAKKIILCGLGAFARK